jgi:hypothetical protein
MDPRLHRLQRKFGVEQGQALFDAGLKTPRAIKAVDDKAIKDAGLKQAEVKAIRDRLAGKKK